MADGVMDADGELPRSLFSGVFRGDVVDVCDRNAVSSYLSQIYSARENDDQARLAVERFHDLARTSRKQALPAQKMREEELRLNQMRFCYAPNCPLKRSGRRYTIMGSLGQFPCLREINGPIRGYGRAPAVVQCAHSEALMLGGTEDVPVLLLLLNDAPFVHHSAVKSIRVVPLQPSGAADLTRSVVRVYRMKRS